MDAIVDLLAQARHLALADALHAERLPGRRPSGSRCLGCRPPGSRRSAPSPTSGAARGSRGSSYRAGALGSAARRFRPGYANPGRDSRCAGWSARRFARRARRRTRLGLQRHQARGSKADHLAQHARVRRLLQQRVKGDLVVGHRGGPRVGVACRSSTLPSTAAVATAVDTAATPPSGTRLVTTARQVIQGNDISPRQGREQEPARRKAAGDFNRHLATQSL